MKAILVFISFICAEPRYYNKFQMYGDDKKEVMKYRCKRELRLCHEFTSDIVNCYNQLDDL